MLDGLTETQEGRSTGVLPGEGSIKRNAKRKMTGLYKVISLGQLMGDAINNLHGADMV